MTKRQHALVNAKVAGYHNDTARFTRLIVEERVNRPDMNAAWCAGVAAKAAGVRCGCYFCNKAEA